MPLNPQQIDRYSRQIIVPGMGGRAQERLLGSRLVLVGDGPNLEPALLYMTGAGVGTIELATADDSGSTAPADAMRHLNGDVTIVAFNSESRPAPDVILAIIESAASLNLAHDLLARFPRTPSVIARVDSPPRIVVLPSPPPCPRCAGDVLMSRPGGRAERAPIIAMAATVEAFKLLAGYAKDSRANMIDFNGYESHLTRLAPDPNCDCAKTGA